jgi:hypothetical protein
MTINPTSPNGPKRPLDSAELDRSRRAAAPPLSAAPVADAADGSTARADSVEVSSEARALAEASGVRPTRSSLPPERLEQIGERLATGFYDRPEVVAELARRLVSHPDFQRGE